MSAIRQDLRGTWRITKYGTRQPPFYVVACLLTECAWSADGERRAPLTSAADAHARSHVAPKVPDCGVRNPRTGMICNIAPHSGLTHWTMINGERYDWQEALND
jgi:hypothetical protein